MNSVLLVEFDILVIHLRVSKIPAFKNWVEGNGRDREGMASKEESS
jgi:hypothetical protein